MKKMKIGRNDPCICGNVDTKTGKPIKYKKCCLLNPKSQLYASELVQIKQKLDQQSNERKLVLRNKGIFIDFPAPQKFQGKAVWALGSRIYYHPNENLTFHEALFYVLSMELGKEWVEQQEELPLKNRHFILKCHHAYLQLRRNNSTTENLSDENKWSAIPDGLTKSLLSLAFDVACIIHTHGHLPKGMIHRLRLSDSNYQGVRYEIAVAGLFARLGCKFEFLDELFDGLKQVPGHCEFFAIEPETKTKIAVEAKSKVRKGILHEPGQSKDFQLWNNVTGPYIKALSQAPSDTPFFVFVDVNSPPTPGIEIVNKPWVKEILENRKKTPANKPNNPDPCTAIVYTNYSYHYQTVQEAKANEALIVLPDFPKHAVPERVFEKLYTTINNYSFIPNIKNDGKIEA